MRIPLPGTGSDHGHAGLKKKSKKKPVFALAKKKAQTLLTTLGGSAAQVGLCWWVQQPGQEDEAWSSNLAMNL